MQSDPVESVLAQLRNVRRVGTDRWTASCPTRRDANPSLSIRRGEDGRCLLKDFGGSTTEEIVDALGMTMGDLFADDAKARTWQMSTATVPQKKKVYKRPEPTGAEGLGERGLKWFADRSIPEEVVRRFGVYSENNVSFLDGGQYVRTTALCFPYTKGGVRVNVKFRSATKKLFTMFLDGEPCFWGLDDISPEADRIVVVEGELDRMALATAGIENVLSPPNGAKSLTDEVMASAEHILGRDGVKVVLAGDMDEAGEEMMADFARRVGRERCFRVRWPTNCKDANDTLVQHGAATLAALMADPEPLPVDGIIAIRDVSDDLWQMFRDGLPPGFSTGSKALDARYTVKPGYLTVVTGSSGSGKSTLLDWVFVNMAELHGWSFGLCSFENQVTRHVASLAAKRVRKPFREGFSSRMGEEELREAAEWIDAHFGFVRPKVATIDEILVAMRAVIYRKGARAILIDPWNRITHDDSMNSGDMVARVYNKIGEFAARNDVAAFLVAHPTKLPKGADGTYPVAHLSDISGSVNHWNMADYGLSVYRHRNDPAKPSEVHILKARHDEVASEGVVLLHFDRATGRYYDVDEPVAPIPGLERVETVTTWRPAALPLPAYIGEEGDSWEEGPDQSRLDIGYAAADGDD